MANEFKNGGGAIGVTDTAIYTTPATKTAVAHSVFITNTHATGSASVTIKVLDNSESATRIVSANLLIPAGVTHSFDKPINLESEDVLQLLASEADKIECFVSILEVS
jgi:hypothetical protein